MLKLEFLNPTFYEGLNVTVRKGKKWKDIFDSGCREVIICETGGPALAIGQLKAVEYCKFNEIKQEWLDLEHDKDCQCVAGLIEAMKKAYGETFSFTDEVSVVFFLVTNTRSF